MTSARGMITFLQLILKNIKHKLMESSHGEFYFKHNRSHQQRA